MPIGHIEPNNDGSLNYYIHNHLELTVQIHETLDDSNAFRIVGFKVEPMSVKHDKIRIDKGKC